MLGIKKLKQLDSPKFKWDLLVRLIHWSVAILFFSNYFITEPEGIIHEYFGYAIVSLIGIRILWGLLPISHKSTKLSDLKPSIHKIKQHILELFNGDFEETEGHNALGSLMAIALWVFLALSVLTGYVSTTNFGIDFGIDGVHELFVDLTIYLVAIHIFAVIVLSLFFKINLIKTISFKFKKQSHSSKSP